MIAYIKGTLAVKEADYVVIETGGIGYQVLVSDQTIAKIGGVGNRVTLHTYLSVKEDGIALFGFLTREELSLFQKLITVSGVGPKSAVGMLSGVTPQELITAVIASDVKFLCKAPGIGKKTAERIILELKDKFKTEDLFLDDSASYHGDIVSQGGTNEAVEALTVLGYSPMESMRAVSGVYQEGMGTEEILKLALKKMSKF